MRSTVKSTFASPEDQGLVPTWSLTTICNPRSRRAPTQSSGLQGMPMVYIYTCKQNIHTHKGNNNNQNLKR